MRSQEFALTAPEPDYNMVFAHSVVAVQSDLQPGAGSAPASAARSGARPVRIS